MLCTYGMLMFIEKCAQSFNRCHFKSLFILLTLVCSKQKFLHTIWDIAYLCECTSYNRCNATNFRSCLLIADCFSAFMRRAPWQQHSHAWFTKRLQSGFVNWTSSVVALHARMYLWMEKFFTSALKCSLSARDYEQKNVKHDLSHWDLSHARMQTVMCLLEQCIQFRRCMLDITLKQLCRSR